VKRRCAAEYTNEIDKTGTKIRHRHWPEVKAGSASFGALTDNCVIEKIETDLYPTGYIRNAGGRKPTRIDIQRRVPGMVQPGCSSKPVLADDLSK
jgi:hypothetical protein